MFYCLDKTDQYGNPLNTTIYGDFVSGFSRYLSIVYRPCVPKQKTDLNLNETCLIDDVTNQTQLDVMLDRSKKYVDNAEIELFYNYDEFNTAVYGKDKFKRKSKLTSRQFNSISPTFAYAKTSIDTLEDETSFVNLGQYKQDSYMQIQMQPNE